MVYQTENQKPGPATNKPLQGRERPLLPDKEGEESPKRESLQPPSAESPEVARPPHVEDSAPEALPPKSSPLPVSRERSPQNQNTGPREQQGEGRRFSIPQLSLQISGKLNDAIAQGHDTTAFTIAFLMAAAKDAMDLGYTTVIVLVQGIPVVGQALAVVAAPLKAVIGLLLTLTLQYFLFRKGFLKKVQIRVCFWVFGFFFDNLPAFDALPIQSLMVIVAWRSVRKRAKNAAEKLGKIKGMADAEKQKLYRNLVLDGSSLD
ncbi:MAG: hypothetical protein Q7R93_03995 [bacterium]|nr:hypothetical protein [bacterium]